MTKIFKIQNKIDDKNLNKDKGKITLITRILTTHKPILKTLVLKLLIYDYSDNY